MKNVEVSPFQIIGIAIRTSNQNNQAAGDIANLWQRFMAEQVAAKIPNKTDESIYSLYTEYEGDHNLPYTAMLGCKVSSLDEIPEEMVGKSFDGGKYVQTSARGNLAEGLIVNQWMKIWQSDWDRAYTADFEVFGKKAQDPNDAEVDFYVAVN